MSLAGGTWILNARALEPLTVLSFLVGSAFLAADMTNTLVKGSLRATPFVALPRAVKPRVIPPPPALTESNPAPAPLPTTAPPVKLMGTMTGAVPYAVILGPAGKEQQLYKVGDDVGGGWVIDAIHVNRAVLKNGGRKEVVKVTFSETEPAKPRAAAVSAAPGAGVRLDARDVEAALSDLNTVMTQARAVPSMVGGKIAGYAIFDIVPGSLYTKLGVRNNDVIERVNGVEIKSPDAFYRLFLQLRNEKRIVLDLSRNGKRETVNVEIH